MQGYMIPGPSVTNAVGCKPTTSSPGRGGPLSPREEGSLVNSPSTLFTALGPMEVCARWLPATGVRPPTWL